MICRINDRFIEGKNGVFLLQQMLRDLFQVNIKTYAQKALFEAYLFC
jgi:hypothetical protein